MLLRKVPLLLFKYETGNRSLRTERVPIVLATRSSCPKIDGVVKNI